MLSLKPTPRPSIPGTPSCVQKTKGTGSKAKLWFDVYTCIPQILQDPFTLLAPQLCFYLHTVVVGLHTQALVESITSSEAVNTELHDVHSTATQTVRVYFHQMELCIASDGEWPALMNLMIGLALGSVKLLQWLHSCTPSSNACHPVESLAPPSYSSPMPLISCPGLSCLIESGRQVGCTLRARLSMCNKHAQSSGSMGMSTVCQHTTR